MTTVRIKVQVGREPIVLFDGNLLNAQMKQGGRRPRGRPKLTESVDRIDAVLNAALDLFAELGFGVVTMDAVAKRARISKETLYQLFPGKSVLFQAVLENQIRKWIVSEQQEQPTPEANSLQESLEDLIDLMARGATSPQFSVVARLIQEEAFRFPELASILLEHGSERGVSACADIIQHYAEADKVACKNPEEVARLLAGSVDAWVRHSALRQHTITDEERAAWVKRTVSIFLAGRSAW